MRSIVLKNSNFLESIPEGGLSCPRFLFLKPVELPMREELLNPEELFMINQLFKCNSKSYFVQYLVNKFLVFDESILRLALLQHLLHFFFTHRYSICPQVVSHLTCWQHSSLFNIKYSETLHQLFFHSHLAFFIYLIQIRCTTRVRKSAKSICAD